MATGNAISHASGRIDFVDAYKAALIALVVLGHALQFSVADFDGNLAVKAIYSHHMAAFFFLSGFVTWRERFRFGAVWKKLARLLVPFFFWWFASWCAHGGGDFFGSLHSLVRAPDSGLWFLYVLAACQLAHFSLHGAASVLRIPVDVVLPCGCLALMGCELVTGWSQYGFHFVAWYFLFFEFGFCVRKHGMGAATRIAERGRWPAIVLLCAWAATLPCWQRNAAIVLPLVGELPTSIAFGYRLAAAVCAISGAFLLFARVRSASGWATKLGQNTLGVYAVHGMLLAWLAPLADGLPPWAKVPLLFAAALPLTHLLALSVRRIPFAGKWIA